MSEELSTPPPRFSGISLLRYAISAAVSVVANLGAQEAVVRGLPFAPLMLSIITGTIVGFLVKYVIDKSWTFREKYTNGILETQKIFLSGVFSVATTLIFWAFELAFLAIWQTDFAKYTGATIGLTIGYFIKFLLDRSYVFKQRTI